jgi:hypothetical protein
VPTWVFLSLSVLFKTRQKKKSKKRKEGLTKAEDQVELSFALERQKVAKAIFEN